VVREPQEQPPGRRPRPVFIIIGLALVVTGAAMVFLNYSSDDVLTGLGVILGVAGFAIAAFSPSGRRTPPNDNHGRS
jgi:drug/metabolite transporter (DMT)-like permease